MTVLDNLAHTNKAIAKTCASHQINTSAITLIAVSKQQPEAKITEALKAGHTHFGENRVQEAQEHWGEKEITLHLIGPLQTNKVKDAVKLFDVIHTLDREKLAVALATEMQKQSRPLPCFVQVNTGDEDQKSGIAPKDTKNFVQFCCNDLKLDITGLMCIPPIDEPPALHFALLRKLAIQNNLKNLSMGMSADFEKAVPLTIPGGRTFIRLGSAIFGERKIL